jgi:hypothetical protein
MKFSLLTLSASAFLLAPSTQAQVILNPANGHHYEAVAGETDWATAKLLAEASTFMGVSGHLATITDAAENNFVYNMLPGAPLIEYWLGGFHDMAAPNYSEPGMGWAWVTGEPWTFDMWGAGEPNNSPPPEDFLIYLPASFGAATWNDAQASYFVGGVKGWIVEYETTSTSFCVSALNSSGSESLITSIGSNSVAANDLGFIAGPGPANEPGIFYYGPLQIQVPFGDGNRCVGGSAGTIVRMFPFAVADGSGVMSASIDNTNPTHAQVMPGATLNFQAWFRDPAAAMTGFNLSNGLEVTFTP